MSLPYKKSYYLTRPDKLAIDLKNRLIWFVQRGKRGYADCDVWALDYYLSGWLPAAVRQIGNGHGHPVQICTCPSKDGIICLSPPMGCDGAAVWKAITEDIAKGFEAAHTILNDWPNAHEEEVLKVQMEYGLNLFNRYFLNLWD